MSCPFTRKRGARHDAAPPIVSEKPGKRTRRTSAISLEADTRRVWNHHYALGNPTDMTSRQNVIPGTIMPASPPFPPRPPLPRVTQNQSAKPNLAHSRGLPHSRPGRGIDTAREPTPPPVMPEPQSHPSLQRASAGRSPPCARGGQQPLALVDCSLPRRSSLVGHAALGGRCHVLDVLVQGSLRGRQRGCRPILLSPIQFLLDGRMAAATAAVSGESGNSSRREP